MASQPQDRRKATLEPGIQGGNPQCAIDLYVGRGGLLLEYEDAQKTPIALTLLLEELHIVHYPKEEK